MQTVRENKDILRKRVLEARESAGYSLAEAAKLLGFNNYQTLSAIERGTRNINANELSSMARLYGRGLDYFFDEEIAPDPVPLWRKSAEADEKQVQRQFISFLENYSSLENLLGLKRRWKSNLRTAPTSAHEGDFGEPRRTTARSSAEDPATAALSAWRGARSSASRGRCRGWRRRTRDSESWSGSSW